MAMIFSLISGSIKVIVIFSIPPILSQ
jgi:hypothetical protein